MNRLILGAKSTRIAISVLTAGAAMTALIAAGSAAGASPAATKTTTVATTVNCNLGILGTQTLNAMDTQTHPTSVAPGAAISLTKSHGVVTIPAALANDAYSLGARSFAGSITTYTVNGVDVTPKSINGAKTALPFGPVVVKQNTPINMIYPSGGKTFTTGPFKASKKGTASLTLGAIDGVANVYSSSNGTGTPITSIDFTCSPTKTTTLAKVTIT